MCPGLWCDVPVVSMARVQGMLMLFITASGEGWPDIMFRTMDITDIGSSPLRDNNKHAWLFFLAFICVGSFFFLNLFVGVVFDQFMRLNRKLEVRPRVGRACVRVCVCVGVSAVLPTAILTPRMDAPHRALACSQTTSGNGWRSKTCCFMSQLCDSSHRLGANGAALCSMWRSLIGSTALSCSSF